MLILVSSGLWWGSPQNLGLKNILHNSFGPYRCSSTKIRSLCSCWRGRKKIWWVGLWNFQWTDHWYSRSKFPTWWERTQKVSEHFLLPPKLIPIWSCASFLTVEVCWLYWEVCLFLRVQPHKFFGPKFSTFSEGTASTNRRGNCPALLGLFVLAFRVVIMSCFFIYDRPYAAQVKIAQEPPLKYTPLKLTIDFFPLNYEIEQNKWVF